MSTHHSSQGVEVSLARTGEITTSTAVTPKDEKTLYRMGPYAIWYHRLGWPVIAVHHPVFQPDGTLSCSCFRGVECPEKSRGKHPVNAGWQLNEGLAREEFEIRAEWRLNPYANIGIPTGKKWGLFVLDADGPEGIASVSELQAKLGPLPTTPRQRTGGGGEQWFLRNIVHAFPNSVSRLAPKVDTRGEDGQAVAAPSLHRSGRRYRWLLSPSNTPLAALPERWAEYIAEKLSQVKQKAAIHKEKSS
jgi:hypothetical protein